MVPAFGFSVSDSTNVLSLINKVKKALNDTGGAEDDVRVVLQDLEGLAMVLDQLIQGQWGKNLILAMLTRYVERRCLVNCHWKGT